MSFVSLWFPLVNRILLFNFVRPASSKLQLYGKVNNNMIPLQLQQYSIVVVETYHKNNIIHPLSLIMMCSDLKVSGSSSIPASLHRPKPPHCSVVCGARRVMVLVNLTAHVQCETSPRSLSPFQILRLSRQA